jgi:hypothetical protein
MCSKLFRVSYQILDFQIRDVKPVLKTLPVISLSELHAEDNVAVRNTDGGIKLVFLHQTSFFTSLSLGLLICNMGLTVVCKGQVCCESSITIASSELLFNNHYFSPSFLFSYLLISLRNLLLSLGIILHTCDKGVYFGVLQVPI